MNELRKLRESLNITQIEAADILNISRRTYQKYESLNEDNDDKLQYFIFKLGVLRVKIFYGNETVIHPASFGKSNILKYVLWL